MTPEDAKKRLQQLKAEAMVRADKEKQYKAATAGQYTNKMPSMDEWKAKQGMAKGGLAGFLKGTKVKERVYHGTSNLEGLTSFDPKMTGKGTDQLGSGFYFTTHPDEASGYASTYNNPNNPKAGAGDSPGVVAAHLAIKKPIKIGPKGRSLNDARINLSHDQIKQIMGYAPNILDPDESPLGNRIDTSRGVTPKMIHDIAGLYTGNKLHALQNDIFPGSPTEYRHALHKVTGYDGVVKDFGDGRKHYVAWFPEQAKSAIGNRGTYDPTNPDITMAEGGSVEPKKTVKAYKLFRVHPNHPGKLFPLFVDANTPVEMNKWVDAKEGEMKGNKVKSKIGDLAYRPGWHAGDLPIATHIGEKSDPKLTAPDRRPANHAWAEVEMPNDVDWQSEAIKRGTNAQGRVVPVKAHITDQIPVGGHYRYKTNPNMTGNWLIGGSMKVNKVLTDAEVARINKAAGMSDLPRSEPFKKKSFGFAAGGTVAPDEWMAEEHVNHKPKAAKAMASGGQPSLDAMKLALTKHGMYSPLEKAAMGVNRTKGTPAEFMAEASKQPGFRKEEVADRKLQLPDQKLTKAEMLEYLKKSPAPKVTENVLHDFGDEEDALQAASQAIYGQDYDEVYDDRRAREKVEAWVKDNSAKYQDYQMPGGKNYREMLLQTPHFGEADEHRMMELEADKRRSSYPEFWGMDSSLARELKELKARQANMGEQYHSSHWEGHPNVIAHMRLSDRKTPDGKKLLHIEEIQSDWHQEGRKKGYKIQGGELTPKEDNRLTELTMMNPEEMTDAENKELMSLMSRLPLSGSETIANKSRVPDAPFKKNWHELAIKHALHHAAKNGYHGVVITPGQEQADRYDLSKHVNDLQYDPQTGTLKAWDHDGVEVVSKTNVSPEQLSDYIGKEGAQKLMEKQSPVKQLFGADLKVGGEGMKGFYDKIVPDYLNKLGKPHGVKTGKIKIPSSAKGEPYSMGDVMQHHGMTEEQWRNAPVTQRDDLQKQFANQRGTAELHHFPITEPMRQQILQGQPMYKQGGVIHKAEGGNVQPSIAQMRMAINQRANPFDIQNIGVNEAPSMSPKLYMSPVNDDLGYPAPGGVATPNGMPIGGVDQSQQPGQQLMAQPTMQPQGQGQPGQQGAPGGLPGQPPQGGAPGPTGPTPPMGNMLSMTPQGQAMQAMGGAPQGGPPGAPTQPPPVGMARGGRASDTGYLVSTPTKPNPLVGQRFKAEPQGNLAERQKFDIMKHEGKGSIVPIPYDATTRDRLVTEVSGHKLDKPLLTEAGFDYSLDPKHMAEDIGGASNAGIAGRVQKRIDQAAKENEGDVFLMPNTMSGDAENFSHHPAHIVLDLLKQSQLNKKTMKALSDDLRSQVEVVKTPDGYKKTLPYKNFLGYEHPSMMEQVMKGGHGLETTSGNLRKKMMERLGQVNVQKLLDYNLGDLKASILDPELATDPKSYMGHTVVRAKPGASLRPSTHSSYDTDYSGTNVGGMGGNRPLEIMMPDVYSDIHKELTARPAKTVKTDAQMRAQVVGALEKRKEKFAQPINARVINNAGLYEEGLKNGEFDPKNIDSVLAYFKRKGGYKKGGKVKLAPTQDTMRLALTKKKAK